MRVRSQEAGTGWLASLPAVVEEGLEGWGEEGG